MNNIRWPATSFLGMLTDEQRANLLARGRSDVLLRGSALVNQGERGESVFVLLAGLVKVWAASSNGRDTLLGLRSRGDLIGEMGVMAGMPRSARVVASTKVPVRVLIAKEFADYLEAYPDANRHVIATVVHKLRAANERRVEYNSRDAPQRVVAILDDVAMRVGQPSSAGVTIGPEVTQADLASLAAVSVSTIEKALSELEKAGLVERRRRALILTDLTALRERLGDEPGYP